MAKTFAELVTEIGQELQDTGNANWTAAEVGIQLEDALRELSGYSPYVTMETYEFETRAGTDTTGTASHLTDTTETQFRATDTNKEVFNVTDRTRAYVIGYTSTSVLGLSADIMDADEEYILYNRDCWDRHQIYLGDIQDYVGRIMVSYK